MSAETERKTEHVPEWKREEVDDLVSLLEGYASVGIVDVTGIPSRQLQAMRADLHGTARLRMSRNTLIQRALDEVNEGLETLADRVGGQVGVIGTDENPFSLFKTLEASKTPAPINAGEVAPNEIMIPEGDTGMDPGPFVGELQAVGAQAQIMDGSIKVTADSVVAEQGDVVDDQLAGVLSELEIEPKEVGLDLRVVHADGVLFEAEELAIDVDEYRADIESASTLARNLSINAGIPTERTVGTLLSTAAGQARTVGLTAGLEIPELMDGLVGRADGQVRALAARLPPEALPEDFDAGTESAPDEGEGTDESTDDQPAADAEAPDDEADSADEDDEDEDDGGDALGAMFG